MKFSTFEKEMGETGMPEEKKKLVMYLYIAFRFSILNLCFQSTLKLESQRLVFRYIFMQHFLVL